ncbi:SDR family oxidoreductase [Flexivirga alba]|uniref:SDR family oxidoreductase n=1 Tax=Flexivirga alba TaxID=702742 RepID=A0ABW2AFC5_9MICO
MSDTKVALITGGSSGLGRELVRTLSDDGWQVITDARNSEALAHETRDLPGVTGIAGDILDLDHQDELAAAAHDLGRLDLLVHNASTLGPTPLRPLAEAQLADIGTVLRTNAGAPLALTIKVLDLLRASSGVLVGISSDAAVEHYEGWGLYAAGKAALDQFILTVGVETPEIVAYAVDPGDMRTPMHQAAFPGRTSRTGRNLPPSYLACGICGSNVRSRAATEPPICRRARPAGSRHEHPTKFLPRCAPPNTSRGPRMSTPRSFSPAALLRILRGDPA